MTAATTGTMAEYLERRSMPEPNSGCHLWMLGLTASGYPAASWARRPRKGHRLAWEAHRGPIPPGLHVCHKCDVPTCVNPDHLFLGTNAENIADKVGKGRQARGGKHASAVRHGEEHPSAKLTAKDVLAIRASSARQEELAAIYGVSRPLISAIKVRRCWKHV